MSRTDAGANRNLCQLALQTTYDDNYLSQSSQRATIPLTSCTLRSNYDTPPDRSIGDVIISESCQGDGDVLEIGIGCGKSHL